MNIREFTFKLFDVELTPENVIKYFYSSYIAAFSTKTYSCIPNNPQYLTNAMKVLQILQFLGLMAEKIMFWKQANAKASNVDKKEEASHAE